MWNTPTGGFCVTTKSIGLQRCGTSITAYPFSPERCSNDAAATSDSIFPLCREIWPARATSQAMKSQNDFTRSDLPPALPNSTHYSVRYDLRQTTSLRGDQ